MALIHERSGLFEQTIAVVIMTAEEVHTLLERGRTQNDPLCEQHGINSSTDGVEVAEIAPHERLPFGFDVKWLYHEGDVPPLRQHAAVVSASCADHPAIGALGESDRLFATRST